MPDILGYIKLPIFKIGEPTATGRIYDANVVDQIRTKLDGESPVFVEMDPGAASTINLERVCGLLKDVVVEDDEVFGTLQIIKTPHGVILRTLLREGVKEERFRFSMIGSGTVGDDNVVRDYQFSYLGLDTAIPRKDE